MNAAACVTTIAINLYPTTYLVAAYGSLKDHPAESYVGLQNIRNEIYICSRLNNLSAPISQAKGMKNTPVALVFVGSSLVVYFFGPAGAGDDPNASPVYRAVASDLSTFVFTSLTNAPSPNVYMQLTTFSDPAPNNGGLGTVILTHVQNDSNRLVSREDDYLSLRLSGRSLDGGGSGRIYICIGQPLAVAVAS
ncbi:hypothetical protein BJF96_g10319 [Verticillium dahliae]|uniref:Uncharacterized protein n=1 Tax=Verticillium dahliae TaxID=27337 RepID=A0AA44W7M1_VERDA|nr:hypothetical protein BJF96_g10319 [Verticillium dahliae]